MDMNATISRKEACLMLGKKTQWLATQLRYEGFSFPNPVGRDSHATLYDRAEFMQWLHNWRDIKATPVAREDSAVTFAAVMAGQFDRRGLKMRYRFKKTAARKKG